MPRSPHRRRRALPLALACLGLLASPAPLRAEPSAEELELKIELELRRAEMLSLLQRWVELNTGSFNGEGLKEFATALQDPFAALGFEVELVQGTMAALPELGELPAAPIVRARRAAASETAPRFLLVGHYDTVFEPDSTFQHFSRRLDPPEPVRVYGPGVADMKGGLIVLLYALRALDARGDLELAHWTLVLNGDEEIGSLGSRATIEEEAQRADFGFVFEAARRDGSPVASRRGVGQLHLRVRGVAAHAGNAHAEGRSAIRTLADQVLRIEQLTDEARGITLNVGLIEGGEKRNVVPAHASAWIDLRYDRPEDGERVLAEIAKIAEQPLVPGTGVEVWSSLHRPPKPETPEVRALLEALAAVASDLGSALPPPVHSGGGTDGSLMQAAGLPTLDSLGGVGDGAHTEGEYLEAESLVERATMTAILLRRLALRERGGAVESGLPPPTVIAGSRPVERP